MKRFTMYLACFLLSLAWAPHAAPPQQRDVAKPADHKQQAAPPQTNPESSKAREEEGKQPNHPSQPYPVQKKGDVPKRDDPDYTFWALVVNGVLTLITLAIAIAGIVQALAAKEGADIATNSQRSWLWKEALMTLT